MNHRPHLLVLLIALVAVAAAAGQIIWADEALLLADDVIIWSN